MCCHFVSDGVTQARFILIFVSAIWKQGRARCIDMWMHVYRYSDTGLWLVQSDIFYADNKGI